jgi:flagellar motility protein MotE (MotC chaperone)
MARMQVRVLPALIAVSIGALAFKGVDLAKAVGEVANTPATPAEPKSEAVPALLGEQGEEAPPPADTAKPVQQCAPAATDYAAETGVSEQEILVLRSLSDRRAKLEEREAAIATQEQLNAAAGKKLDEQIVQLKGVEANIQKLLAAMDAKKDERMAALVKTYEGMKPKDSAIIFNTMDDKLSVELAKAMKPGTLGAILAAMDVRKAEALTRALAELATTPKPDPNKPISG